MTIYQKWLIEQYTDQLMIAWYMEFYSSELGGTKTSEARNIIRNRALNSASKIAEEYNSKYS